MRIEGWQVKLDEYIKQAANTEFAWGKCDCLIVSSDICVILCGVDPMKRKLPDDPDTIRGRYSTSLGALRLITKLRENHEGIFDVHFTRKPIARMQRGDIVFDTVGENKMFGFCANGKVFFKTENKGFLIKAPTEGAICWHVS